MRFRLYLAASTILAALVMPHVSRAEGIGVMAPLSGPMAVLGEQIAAGARSATASANGSGPLIEADTNCDAEGSQDAARRMVAATADAVVGFLCSAELEAALPILAEGDIPAIDVGVRSDRLLERRQRESWLLWRIAPGTNAEANAIARFVKEYWRGEPFAIIEDGSSYGRDLADNVRADLETASLRPVLIDNYRPAEEKQFGLARRIVQSGVQRILVFGTRSDVAIVARDLREVGSDAQIVGGESLLDAAGDVPLPDGVIAIASGFDVDWVPAETPPDDEGYARVARIGTEIAIEAVKRSRAENRTISDLLAKETFATSAGLVRFDSEGKADLVPYRTYRWQGDRFLPTDEG